MKKFVLRRFAQMIFVWILVSIFSFSIVYFAPGDPLYIYMTPGATGHKMTDEELDRMRESLGLNGNVVEQYMGWAGKAARGNLGISINNKRPVLDQILEKLPSLLLLSEAETEEMYDLAARSRHTVSADLPEYIMEKDIVRAALRTAKKHNVTDQQWEDFIRRITKESE